MKILTPLVCVVSLFLMQSALNAEGLYKWKDARGNLQYGDRPPANVNAQAVNLPKLTIIEKYADQWKPMKFDDSQPVTLEPVVESSNNNTYNKLAFLAPKAGQAIRANDGDVSAMISLKPPLKKGHSIIFAIDGKQSAKGNSRTQNFSGLGRGNHTVGVKVVDAKGKTLKSSSVSFNVLRFSKLSQKQGNSSGNATKIAGQAPKVKLFNDVRTQQTAVKK